MGYYFKPAKVHGFQEAKEAYGELERYVDGPNGRERLGTGLER